VQDRSKRCLFFNPSRGGLSGVCDFRMEKQNLSVSMSLLRAGPSTSHLYKNNEGPNSPNEKIDDSLDNIPGRYSDYGSLKEGDTLIYVLQMLGFVINIKKSVLEPLQKIDFLGVEIDSVDMTTSLPQEKVELIRKHCQDIMGKENVSIRELTSLVGRLSSTAIAVLPAPLQYRYLQRNQIQALSKSQNFDSIIPLSPQAKGEITWWIENLSLSNGRSLLTVPAQLVISSDASLQGWGQHAQAKQQGVHGPD